VDAIDGAVSVTTRGLEAVTTDNYTLPGKPHVIMYSAMDAAGNLAHVNRTVTVERYVAPSAAEPSSRNVTTTSLSIITASLPRLPLSPPRRLLGSCAVSVCRAGAGCARSPASSVWTWARAPPARARACASPR
jgi:hypothetical protein